MNSRREFAYGGGNAILDELSGAELDPLRPYLHVYDEDESAVVQRCNQRIAGAYFPIDSIYSVVVELANGDAFEVGIVGRDGMVGAEILIGAMEAGRSVICQGEGRVAYLDAAKLRETLASSPALRAGAERALRRQWFISQQTVACNFAHTLEQRLGRWLLMSHDAVGRPDFPIRIEFLQMMVGAGEANIRSSLAKLVATESIAYRENTVTVRSYTDLRDTACECYERQRTDRFIESANKVQGRTLAD
jgi:CRP-like cAMP-binding protein